MSSDILSWEEPPADQKNKADRVYAELKAQPGRWAKIYDGPWAIVIWYTQLRDYPDLEMKVHYTTDDMPRFGPREVYARYTGKEEPDAAGPES